MCWYHSAWSKRHRNIVLVKQMWVFAVEAGGGPTWEFSLLGHRTSPWPPTWCPRSRHLPPSSPPFPSIHPDAHSSVQATGMLDSASYMSLLSVRLSVLSATTLSPPHSSLACFAAKVSFPLSLCSPKSGQFFKNINVFLLFYSYA